MPKKRRFSCALGHAFCFNPQYHRDLQVFLQNKPETS